MYYSRWQRKYEVASRKQAYFLLLLSIIFLVVLFFVGLPLILSFSSLISNRRRAPATQTVDTGPAPASPRLVENLTATKSANIRISGISDPNTIVELYQNGASDGTTIASDDGSFVFDVTLVPNSNTFYAQATTPKGQKSNNSEIYTISFTNKSPKLELNNIRDGDTVKDSPFKIVGITDAGDTVTINDRLAMTGIDGAFSLSLNLNNGDNKLKIIAVDAAGNQTTKELTLKYSP